MNPKKVELISSGEVARILGISRMTVHRWEASGKLPCVRGKKRAHKRFRMQDVLRCQKGGSRRPPITLSKTESNTFIFDFDSTLFAQETLESLINQVLRSHPDREAIVERIEDIGRRGMAGEIPLAQSLGQRLAVAPITRADIKTYARHAKELLPSILQPTLDALRARGQKTIVISSGFIEWILPLAERMGFDRGEVFCNALTFDARDRVTGVQPGNPLTESNGKALLTQELKESGFLTGTVCMVGDGMSDLLAAREGGADYFLGYGVYADREAVREQSSYFFTDQGQFHDFVLSLFPKEAFKISQDEATVKDGFMQQI